jgi:hypothetical protein
MRSHRDPRIDRIMFCFWHLSRPWRAELYFYFYTLPRPPGGGAQVRSRPSRDLILDIAHWAVPWHTHDSGRMQAAGRVCEKRSRCACGSWGMAWGHPTNTPTKVTSYNLHGFASEARHKVRPDGPATSRPTIHRRQRAAHAQPLSVVRRNIIAMKALGGSVAIAIVTIAARRSV